MDKKQEIEVLQSLKDDTYFAQFFGGLDIDLMCENIKNDFPIELNCAFYQKAELFKKQVDQEKAKAKERMENFVKGVIDDFDGYIPMEVYDRLVDATSHLFIISFKREKGYKLTESEIDWLINEVIKK
jgi:hypothetical protein